MNDEKIIQLDALIVKVKAKIDRVGMTAADMFIVLTLEILRGELVSQSEITERTMSACIEIWAGTSHYYYYRDYPELYAAMQDYFVVLQRFDSRFRSADFPSLGFERDDWQEYIVKASVNLLGSLSMSYAYRKE